MGVYFNRNLEDGSTLSVWEITESEEELMTLSSIPSDELEDLAITKSASRRRERLAVRALLNNLFDGKVYLGHHDNGRPFLQNSIIEISISHTNRFVAIITHPFESVGVDIESLDRNFERVSTKILSEDELEDLGDKNRDVQLAIYWSVKEAIFKRMSQTDVDFIQQIQVSRFSVKDRGEVEAIFINKEGKEQEFNLNYEIFAGHVLVWVVG